MEANPKFKIPPIRNENPVKNKFQTDENEAKDKATYLALTALEMVHWIGRNRQLKVALQKALMSLSKGKK